MVYYRRDEDFDGALKPAASRYGVPLWLAKGLISMESGWDPESTRYEPSGSNDVPHGGDIDASFGLMQVTGGAVLQYAGASGFGLAVSPAGVSQVRGAQIGTNAAGKPVFNLQKLKAALIDPTLNIDMGMRELADHLKQYGDPGAAVAAYNMGFPRTIQNSTRFIAGIYDKWAIRQGYGSYVQNFDLWKVHPPEGWKFANQPYVNDVLARAALYRAREEGRPAEEARIHAFLVERPSRRLLEAIRLLPQRVAVLSSSGSSSPSPSPSSPVASTPPAKSAA